MADERWKGGLGLVFGGPGLGKSTLVRQAMEQSAALGRGEEVLVRSRPDWTASALEDALFAALGVDRKGAADNAESLVEYLWSRAPTRVGIVLDDFHVLDESAVEYALRLRALLPLNAHLLVASRENPQLTARLVTADPLFVIDAGDLLFTSEEVASFASETGAELGALERAGGWPAVLALTASAGSDVAGAYLYQSVLSGLSDEQQSDLTIAAHLGEVDVDLARRVLSGAPSALGRIPLVDVNASGVIVHDLWREQVSGMVEPDVIGRAVRIAADAAVEARDVDRAVSLLLSNGLDAEARRVILAYVVTAPDRVPIDRVERWLRMLTSIEHALLRQVLQLLREGLVAGGLANLELDDITRRCRSAGELDLEAMLVELRFSAAWSADDVELCIDLADRLAQLNDEGVQLAAHAPFMLRITAARAAGDNTKVIELIGQTRQEIGDQLGIEWNVPLELETLVALGRPFEALHRMESSLHALSERNVRSVAYALTYWFAGKPGEAIASLEEQLAEPGRFRGIERSWRATLALFRNSRGLESEVIWPPAEATDNFSTYSRVCEGLARIARFTNELDAQAAETALHELAEELPPVDGFTMQAWFMGASLWYVYRPGDRAMLDSFMTRDGFERTLYGRSQRVLAALVALRDGGPQPTAEDVESWPSAAQVATMLPVAWAAEVALRITNSPDFSSAILDELEEAGRPALERLAGGPDTDLAALAAHQLEARPAAPAQHVSARLFGPPQLVVEGAEEPKDWRRGRVRALLGLLARRGRMTREAVIDVLWPDLDADAGRRNLRVTLSYLTRCLEPNRPSRTPPWFVRSEGEMLELNPVGLELDALVLQNALALAVAEQARGVATSTIDALRIACAEYRGPFLEGLDDEWILEDRSLLQVRMTDACVQLAALLDAGRSEEAEQWARRAVEIDPLSIAAHEAVVNALSAAPAPIRRAAEEALEELFAQLA